MRRLVERVQRLQRLAAFEAAVRLGSFTAAASELGMTQPAVTRQIRALEQSLDLELFVRSANRSSVTPAGQRLADAIVAGFGGIEAALDELGADDTVFVLASPPGFAQQMIVPFLEAIQEALGGRDIRLWLYDRDSDLDAGGYHVAVRVGSEGWPGCDEEPLFDEVVQPVATPALAAQLGLDAGSEPIDVLDAPLIHMENQGRAWMSWEDWLAHFDLALTPGRPRVLLNTYPLVLQQALAGRGVALGWHGIVDSFVDDGLLVPVGPAVPSASRYSAAWRRGRRVGATDTMVRWLRDRVTSD